MDRPKELTHVIIKKNGNMGSIVITDHLGLVGSYCAIEASTKGKKVYGIDNDLRSKLFSGLEPISGNKRFNYEESIGIYKSFDLNISNEKDIYNAFTEILKEGPIDQVIHCAAQPSHDWAASDPYVDFNVNALGTLIYAKQCEN